MACDFATETGEHVFETCRTAPEALEEMLVRRCPDRVVIEVGPAAGWISDWAARLRIELQVANPSHQGWRWRSVKKKTDRVDALKLAQLPAVNQLPLVDVPSKDSKLRDDAFGFLNRTNKFIGRTKGKEAPKESNGNHRHVLQHGSQDAYEAFAMDK